jgi:hypothetical protein
VAGLGGSGRIVGGADGTWKHGTCSSCLLLSACTLARDSLTLQQPACVPKVAAQQMLGFRNLILQCTCLEAAVFPLCGPSCWKIVHRRTEVHPHCEDAVCGPEMRCLFCLRHSLLEKCHCVCRCGKLDSLVTWDRLRGQCSSVRSVNRAQGRGLPDNR